MCETVKKEIFPSENHRHYSGAHRSSAMMIPTRCWNILGKKVCMRNAV